MSQITLKSTVYCDQPRVTHILPQMVNKHTSNCSRKSYKSRYETEKKHKKKGYKHIFESI